MDAKKIVMAAMTGVSLNQGGRDVVLYLDEMMRHTARMGRRFYLPVIGVEGSDGYVEFLENYRTVIAEWFGEDFEQAQAKVDEINREVGYEPADALDLIGESIARAAGADHEAWAKLRR